MSADDFSEYREAQRIRRAERLPIRTAQILALRSYGYKIVELTPYQFRVNDAVDLYPIHNNYHVIRSGKRGSVRNLSEFVKKNFKPQSW